MMRTKRVLKNAPLGSNKRQMATMGEVSPQQPRVEREQVAKLAVAKKSQKWSERDKVARMAKELAEEV